MLKDKSTRNLTAGEALRAMRTMADYHDDVVDERRLADRIAAVRQFVDEVTA